MTRPKKDCKSDLTLDKLEVNPNIIGYNFRSQITAKFSDSERYFKKQ